MTMGFTYAVAREVVEKYGKEKFGVHPVGTGPYRVVEWARGSRLRMALRPEYKGPPPKAMPAIDVQIGGDTFTAQMMFERGLIDFRTEIPPPDHVRITTSPQWKNCVHRAEEVDFNYLAFNCEMEPFTNKQVRQALSHAINKDRLLQSINNRGVIARGVLPPLMPGYNKELKERYPYDPERAKKMLAEAGYPNGFSMQLWVSFERPDWMKMAQQVQQDFKAVGVQVVIKEVSGNTFIDISGKRGAAQSLIYGWVQDYPDPSDFLDVLFNGERIADENCNNTSFYDNKDVNERLKEAQRVTTDQAKRLRLYQDIEKQIVEDAPMVFLYHAVDYRQCQPWLKGYQTHPVWWVRYDKIWVESP
jgi:peptide/nickel transport system substrate-binding protein